MRPGAALGGPEDRPGERTQGSGDVTPPTVIQHVDAVYPSSALAARKHATVMLRVTVDADGHVSNVEVVTSGGEDLDEAATIAARQWLFEPAKRRGVPVASRISIPFHFAPPAPPPEIVEPKPPADELPPYPAAQAAAPSPVTPSGAAAVAGVDGDGAAACAAV